MKIEELIEKLSNIAKANPGMEVKVDTNSSWPCPKLANPVLTPATNTETNTEFLLIEW